MHIGLKIKELVELKKVSPQELALKIGKRSKQSIYDYYKKESIDAHLLEDIANALGVSVKVFFEKDEKDAYSSTGHYNNSIHAQGKNIYQGGAGDNKGQGNKDAKDYEIAGLEEKVSYLEKQVNYLEQRLADKDEMIKQKDELIQVYKKQAEK